ncbi:MAG: hypothetical protein ABIR91_00030 [Candidatus Saccharimonadales bacterium]
MASTVAVLVFYNTSAVIDLIQDKMSGKSTVGTVVWSVIITAMYLIILWRELKDDDDNWFKRTGRKIKSWFKRLKQSLVLKPAFVTP